MTEKTREELAAEFRDAQAAHANPDGDEEVELRDYAPLSKGPDHRLVVFVSKKQRVPVSVSTGVLTQHEFDAASPDAQAMAESIIRGTLRSGTQAWIDTNRDYLRDDMAFFAGVPIEYSED
jgi:hypothetical protein